MPLRWSNSLIASASICSCHYRGKHTFGFQRDARLGFALSMPWRARGGVFMFQRLSPSRRHDPH
jgi:hypothetical protein